MRRGAKTIAAAFVAGAVLTAGIPATAQADTYRVSSDSRYVTSSELAQLREGMTLPQVQSLFGSEGKVTYTYNGSYHETQSRTWYANSYLDYGYGITGDRGEVDVTFTRDKDATRTETYYATETYYKYKYKKNKKKSRKRGYTVYKRVKVPRTRRVAKTREVPVATVLRVESFYTFSQDTFR